MIPKVKILAGYHHLFSPTHEVLDKEVVVILQIANCVVHNTMRFPLKIK